MASIRASQGGVQQLGRITVDELATHNTKDDCWQAYGGKVYNVTPYLKYHPGGVPQLMKAAGKDGQCLSAFRGGDDARATFDRLEHERRTC